MPNATPPDLDLDSMPPGVSVGTALDDVNACNAKPPSLGLDVPRPASSGRTSAAEGGAISRSRRILVAIIAIALACATALVVFWNWEAFGAGLD